MNVNPKHLSISCKIIKLDSTSISQYKHGSCIKCNLVSNFICVIFHDFYEYPTIIDCPCKFITCRKCLSRCWEIEIRTNDFQLQQSEELKRCDNNY